MESQQYISHIMRPQERLIEAAELKKLTAPKPWKFVWDYFFDFAVIAAAIAVNERFFFNPLVYLGVVIVIGSRFNALTILMHETSHFLAFRSNTLNYLFGEPVGWLVLASMEGYRMNHMAHHRKLNTLEDPDWTRKFPQKSFHYPKSKQGFWLDVLKQGSGIGFVRTLSDIMKSKTMTKSIPVKIKRLKLAFYLAIIAVCAITGTLHGLVLYWIIPLMTVFNLALWLRSLAEHYNLEYDHPYNHARSMKVNPVEAFLLTPHRSNYHAEHHLYPGVPYHHLDKLHRILMENPAYAGHAHITKGIAGLARELSGDPVGPSFDQMVAWQKEANS